MSKLNELYEQLKKERIRLQAEFQRLKAEEKTADQQREGSPFGKREEGATEAFEMEKRMALEQRLNMALAEVEHAIQKYEAGIYDICDICGNTIELARLEALPQASLCLQCKASRTKDARGRASR